jgi:hypothetical protein
VDNNSFPTRILVWRVIHTSSGGGNVKIYWIHELALLVLVASIVAFRMLPDYWHLLMWPVIWVWADVYYSKS